MKKINKKWDKTGNAGELIYKQFSTSMEVANYTIEELKKILKKSPNPKHHNTPAIPRKNSVLFIGGLYSSKFGLLQTYLCNTNATTQLSD